MGGSPCSVFLSLPSFHTCCELVANHISHFEVFMMRACVIFLAFVAVALAEVFLDERFADGDAWEKRWIQSTNKGEAAGKFVLTHGKFYGDAEKDLGIQTSQDARFYGLSTKFQPLSSTDSPLVIQFTVNHKQNIDCGGGYVKLFDCNLAQEDMHGDSPYLIMFGPDICGPSSKKEHVIFNYKGQNHLIKNEKVESGDLEADWDFLPAKTIKDPEAKKPEDWDDRAKIDDPEDVKPEDWEKPEHIVDPEAKKPEDWDDEMDGEWEPPMIDNPEYKGEWKPKQID